MPDHKSFITQTRDQVAEISTRMRAEIEERQTILDSLEDIEYTLDRLIEGFEEEDNDTLPDNPFDPPAIVVDGDPDYGMAERAPTTTISEWLRVNR